MQGGSIIAPHDINALTVLGFGGVRIPTNPTYPIEFYPAFTSSAANNTRSQINSTGFFICGLNIIQNLSVSNQFFVTITDENGIISTNQLDNPLNAILNTSSYSYSYVAGQLFPGCIITTTSVTNFNLITATNLPPTSGYPSPAQVPVLNIPTVITFNSSTGFSYFLVDQNMVIVGYQTPDDTSHYWIGTNLDSATNANVQLTKISSNPTNLPAGVVPYSFGPNTFCGYSIQAINGGGFIKLNVTKLNQNGMSIDLSLPVNTPFTDLTQMSKFQSTPSTNSNMCQTITFAIQQWRGGVWSMPVSSSTTLPSQFPTPYPPPSNSAYQLPIIGSPVSGIPVTTPPVNTNPTTNNPITTPISSNTGTSSSISPPVVSSTSNNNNTTSIAIGTSVVLGITGLVFIYLRIRSKRSITLATSPTINK